MQEKDVSYFHKMAADQFERVYAAQMAYDRCRPAAELAKVFEGAAPVEICRDAADAYARAAAYARGTGAMIVCAGSLYLAGEMLDLLDETAGE